ncbi:uncharacterized protein H6S33_008761 [Morchella sextelata]|uniref:uncharacterized protein n=1 Tax=Morchella sextelata TaxID=1174677 RepID=UPI001D0516BE|nr:uncharacterized protein H6S33_008761 [Morchella sextelata]KAH0602422.1 hypothetical protein H6S33_008761 [Morchella sextelata]
MDDVLAPPPATTTTTTTAGLELTERDEAGNITAVFTELADGGPFTVVVPEDTVSYAQRLLNVFLPAGFPASVSGDYVGYQIYDSLQAFSSSIAGLLTSRAVLQGFGVGDANASATGALLLTIVQDSVSRLATILFAYRFGVALEAECKKYRLAADVFNDSAMILDCLSPAFPGPVKIVLLCLSGSLRAACGVAGGGSKASLSVHFARAGNVGELNAKDSSQETVIGLMGMLAGSFVVRHITTTWATWVSLTLLLALHLGTNYMAVTSVALRTLNRQRANIVFSRLSDDTSGTTGANMVTPARAARLERIFERDGVLRWRESEVLGFARIGATFCELAAAIASGGDGGGGGGFPTVGGGGHSRARGGLFPSSRPAPAISIHDIAKVFRNEKHLLWYDARKREVTICLKNDITSEEQLKAWVHALFVAKKIRHHHHHHHHNDNNSEKKSSSSSLSPPLTNEEILGVIETTLFDLGTSFATTVGQLRAVGWDLGTAALETKPGYRVGICSIDAGKDKDEIRSGGDEAKKDI